MGKDTTFAQTDSLSVAFGAYLQGLGLEKGDRVALMMPNMPQYPIAVAAILRRFGGGECEPAVHCTRIRAPA